ncbi:MAG: hypothetical protein LBQ99_00460 [Endomicrobium sp.]|jgi:G:T/U-mismatch repair DNA glycosylase|nr:hypothetical protein [Endomicrobium sp.]
MITELHPFKPFIPHRAKMLVVGTFPPLAQYHDFKFYYPNSTGNRFWVIVEYVFDHKFQYWKGDLAVNERKFFLIKKRIAITDMIDKCLRSNSNSSDKNLCNIKFRNVYKLLKDQSRIQKVILTSRTYGSSEQIHKKHLSKPRNNSALELFNENLRENGIIIESLRKMYNGVIEGEFKLTNRIIKIFVPYTPVAKWFNIAKVKVNNMYKYSFNSHIL